MASNRIEMTAVWQKVQTQWYGECKITIKNLTEDTLINPTIEFTLPANSFYTPVSGFKTSDRENTIKGCLAVEPNIAPNEETSFTIGINASHGGLTNDSLPANFKVDGKNIVVPVDPEPPVVDPEPPVVDPEPPVDPEEGNEFDKAVFADFTGYPPPNLADFNEKTGIKKVILGFAVGGEKDEKNTFLWGGNPVLWDPTQNKDCSGDPVDYEYGKKIIEDFKAVDGEVIVSFGGASGLPLEAIEQDVEVLVEKYDNIIKAHSLKSIDLDFEGAFLSAKNSLKKITKNQENFNLKLLSEKEKSVLFQVLKKNLSDNSEQLVNQEKVEEIFNAIKSAALDTHIQVIKKVIESNPDLKVTYTLPADYDGWNQDGINFVQKLHDAGIKPYFNNMLMEFRDPDSDLEQSDPKKADLLKQNLFENCKLGLESIVSKVCEIYKWNESEAKSHISACPMFGENNNGKVYTHEDHKKLVSLCKDDGYKGINGWDLLRDLKPASEIGLDTHNPGDFGRITTENVETLGENYSLDAA